MKISKDARKASKSLYLKSFTDGRLDEAKVRTVGQALIEKKPRNYLEMLKNYQRLVRMEVEKRHAVIESAAALDDATREELLKNLRAKYGNELTTDFKVIPELIGGVRIRVGSDVWDSSIRGRLALLESNLAAA